MSVCLAVISSVTTTPLLQRRPPTLGDLLDDPRGCPLRSCRSHAGTTVRDIAKDLRGTFGAVCQKSSRTPRTTHRHYDFRLAKGLTSG
jgi:hypothetical protein